MQVYYYINEYLVLKLYININIIKIDLIINILFIIKKTIIMNITTNELDLPDNFSEYSTKNQQLILAYLTQLSPLQKQAYSIAKQHLGTSFHILKSNAYIHWLKNISN